MLPTITSSWPMFCIAFGGMLFLALLMSLQSIHFYTKDVIIRKFSIIELQLPSAPKELVNIIKGLYNLPAAQSKKTIGALKGQLYLDFIFMPFAYGSVALLCMQAAYKMNLGFGENFFKALAYLQLVAWLCDIIENIYLLGKISPQVTETKTALHNAYLYMECVKWGLALTGVICAVAAICYFWLTGGYLVSSLRYLLIIVVEIIVFLVASRLFFKPKDVT